MTGSVFNNLIDEYIKNLTPGAFTYRGVIELCKVPESVVSVSDEAMRKFDSYVMVFDDLCIFDRLEREKYES